jgi:DNA-binding transcriptional MocR family regulator
MSDEARATLNGLRIGDEIASAPWPQNQRRPSTTIVKAVLRELATCHNYHTGKCCPSVSYIAELLECSMRTVQRALQMAEAAGLVRRLPSYKPRDGRKRGGAQEANDYQLMFVRERNAPPDTVSPAPLTQCHPTPPDTVSPLEKKKGNKKGSNELLTAFARPRQMPSQKRYRATQEEIEEFRRMADGG